MNIKSWAKAITFCALVFLSLAGYKAMQIQSAMAFADSFPEPSETTASTYSHTVSYTKTLETIGEVQAPQEVSIFSETPGRIVEVGFQSGDHVKKGQVLIQLDISEEAAMLDAEQARLDLANSVYKRNKNLFATKAVSEEQFDRARVDVATIKAEIARLNSVIRKKTITAPFSGVTGLHHFKEGSFLLDNVLITQLVGEHSEFWIDFMVPQFYPLLETGALVQVQLLKAGEPVRNDKGEGNIDGIWVDAKVLARSVQVDPNSRSYQYRASVPTANFKAGIKTGVSVRVGIDEPKQLTAVPVTAVQQDHLGQFVYLLKPIENEEGAKKAFRAVRQAVEVEVKQNKLALIKQGLDVDRLLASDGAFKLYPGLLVYSDVQEKLSLTTSKSQE